MATETAEVIAEAWHRNMPRIRNNTETDGYDVFIWEVSIIETDLDNNVFWRIPEEFKKIAQDRLNGILDLGLHEIDGIVYKRDRSKVELEEWYPYVEKKEKGEGE